MSTPARKKKARFYPASDNLRQKMGTGGIDPQVLERAEQQFAQAEKDYLPLAAGIFKKLETAIAEVSAEKIGERDAIERIAGPVMELKATGGMFGYALISEIAAVALDFLENVDAPDKDVMDIVKIHQRSLNAILTSRIKGQGGKEGLALSRELQAACQRYYTKHNITP